MGGLINCFRHPQSQRTNLFFFLQSLIFPLSLSLIQIRKTITFKAFLHLLRGFLLCRPTMAVFGGANLGSVSFSSHLLNQQSCFLSCPLRLPSSSSNRTSHLCLVKSFSGSVTADTDTSSDQSLLRDTSNDAGPSRVRFTAYSSLILIESSCLCHKKSKLRSCSLLV